VQQAGAAPRRQDDNRHGHGFLRKGPLLRVSLLAWCMLSADDSVLCPCMPFAHAGYWHSLGTLFNHSSNNGIFCLISSLISCTCEQPMRSVQDAGSSSGIHKTTTKELMESIHNAQEEITSCSVLAYTSLV
jgi:hypothetical protein